MTTPVVWRLAAGDAAGLRARLADLVGTPGAPERSCSVGAGPVRLAVVDPAARKAKLADRLVSEGEPWGGRSDVWFSPSALALAPGGGGGTVAFLFPGVEPTFGADGIDLAALAGAFGFPTPDVTEDTVAHRSAAIIRLGILLDGVLRRVGVVPDLVGGHSIGEWSATVSAGMSTPADAEALIRSVDLGAVDLPQVDFAAVVAGADQVMAALGGLAGIELSHDNCGKQSVICGPPDRVAEAMAVLGGRNILGQVLDFRSGFHTSALLPLLPRLRDHIERFPLGPRSTPIWSATTGAPLPDDLAAAREVMTRHLVEPVRFRPMVEAMYEAGARVFVQPGIGNLTGFVDDILDGRPHAAVPVVTAKRPALAQFHRALAALWVDGVESTWPSAAPEPSPAPVRMRDPLVGNGSRTQSSPPPAPAPAATTAVLDPAAVHPVLAAAAAVVDNAARATRDIVAAWAAAPTRTAVRRPVPAGRLRVGAAAPPAPAAPAPAAPPVPEPEPVADQPVEGRWPASRFTITYQASLDRMPYMLDHVLFRQPEGWPDVADSFPIVAMTTQLEVLAEIARRYAPDRDVIELSDVRNYRWLDISDPVDLEVSIVPEGDDVLRIALGPYARAKVRVGRYPAPARYERTPLRNPRPASITPQQLWDDRIMFHGPRFHGVRRLGPVGDDGIQGELEGMPDPGPLLDNVGKLIAVWTMEQRGWGEGPLPIGVGNVAYSGPPPAPGKPVPTDVRITDLDEDFVVGEAVLCRPDGTTWCHIEGWRMHIFHRDEVMRRVSARVEDNLVADAEPDGLLLQYERWPGTPTRDLWSHQALRRGERATYESLTPADRRAWLLEVTAVKEAARHWLRNRFGLTVFPVEVDVRPDGPAWVATSPRAPGNDLRVALARDRYLVAAVASDRAGEPLAVDLRPVPEGADGEGVAAALAGELAARHPGATVRHRALPATTVGGNEAGPRAVAWLVPTDSHTPRPQGAQT